MALEITIYPRNIDKISDVLVVLVHGLGAPSTWENGDMNWRKLLLQDTNLTCVDVAIIKYDTAHVALGLLHALGIETVGELTVGKGPFTDIKTLAHELKRVLENEAKDYKRIIIIGHSMGGLIGIRYILEEAEATELTRIIGFISMATPFNGANSAFYNSLVKIIHNHAQIPNLVPNNIFLDDTIRLWKKHEKSLNLNCMFCYGTNDEWVSKESAIPHIVSSKWSGSVPLPGDHSSFLKNTSTYVAVSQYIQKIIYGHDETRQSVILELEKISKARCISRWQATGLTRQMAENMANTIDYNYSSLEPNDEKPISLLIGEFGVGKSLISELIFQKWLIEAKEHGRCPIPIFVEASEKIVPLNEYIKNTQLSYGDDNRKEFRLIIDGMDQVSIGLSSQILDQARTIVQVCPGSKIVMTSRPIPTFCNLEETKKIPKLSERESYQLISCVVGKEINETYKTLWPLSVREALSRPLFAILLGLYMHEEDMRTPRSTGDLLVYLTEKSLVRAGINNDATKALLRRLAILSTDRGNVSVLKSELNVEAEDLNRITGSGLVLENNNLLSFSLPITSQWFAAQALADGTKNADDFRNDLQAMEFWRYPFIILISFFGHDLVYSKFAVIVENNPAMAAVIVEEGLTSWGMIEGVAPPPAIESGKRIRSTMESWVKGLGNLVNLIAPVDQDGKVLPLGVSIYGGGLQTLWYEGDDAKPDIFELLGDIPDEPGSYRFSCPGRYATWAWRWTLDDLNRDLSKLVKGRALWIDQGPIWLEYCWELALKLTSHGTFYSGGISISKLKKVIRDMEAANFVRSGNHIGLRLLKKRIRCAELEGNHILSQPWPGPDMDCHSGYVWNFYSRDRLLERTSIIYQKSIEAYMQLVDTYFSNLKNRMRTYNILPAILKGELIIRNGEKMRSHPAVSWYLDPLPLNQESRVEITLCESREETHKDSLKQLQGLYDKVRQLRPRSAEWIGGGSTSQLLDIFDTQPVTEIAYKWLWDDLKSISWVD